MIGAMLRHSPAPRRRTSWLSLSLITATCAGIAGYALHAGALAHHSYDEATRIAQFADSSRLSMKLGDQLFFVATPELLSDGKILSLVSSASSLPASYEPSDLIQTSLPHGDSSQPMTVESSIEQPLRSMFEAAQSDGYELMISSAYRSVKEQTALLAEYRTLYGSAIASDYVATPGTSEHHTGMSVDISDATTECRQDSDQCNLSPASAQWLRRHAPEYGFILRYPDGKEAVTGIAFEPWHFRYVGVPLARLITENETTLDEAWGTLKLRPIQ